MKRIYGETELKEVAQELLSNFPDRRIFAFYGKMGVGKTTLITEVCHLLGVEEGTASPTFAIISEYNGTPPNGSIYHFDCYRLETSDDAYNVGAEEYLESGNYCFIEWPEVMEPFLPEETVVVNLSAQPDGRRLLETLT